MKFKNMKLKMLSSALMMAGLGAGAAHALPLAPLFNAAPTATLLSDNSAEFLVNVDGSVGAGGSPTVTVGDILVSIVGINTLGTTTIGSGTSFNELTALTAIKVSSAVDTDLGPAGSDDSLGSQNIDLWQFGFTALAAGDAAAAGFNFSDFSGASGATTGDGTITLAFEDAANDYTRDGTIAQGITSSTGGDLRFVVALDGGGDFFSAIAPLNVNDFLALPSVTAVDNANLALDGTITFQNFPGLALNTNITGGNGGLSSSSNTAGGFPIFDNLDFTVNANRVPEPASLALIGIGLLGFGAMRRSKRS